MKIRKTIKEKIKETKQGEIKEMKIDTLDIELDILLSWLSGITVSAIKRNLVGAGVLYSTIYACL